MNWKRIWETISNWEQWPFNLRYLLISPVWLWYCIRSGSFWFFTPSNPTLTFGGFEGETKKEMYDLLPKEAYPKTTYIHPTDSFEVVKEKIQHHHFTYPFCVKPDVGMKGLLFRKIDSEKELAYYHQHMPVEYLVQELAAYPLEVSVFYYRFPDAAKGCITGFIQKDLMEVIGNGKYTLLELIQQHPKARFRQEEMRIKHADHLHTVLPPDQVYYLSYAANLNRGARFTNLQHLVDEELTNVFDAYSHKGQFFYGRFDIKCRSIADLKKGEHFCILEYNGSGAEPNHIYNAGLTLFQAHKVILFHWKVLYQISRYNYKKGIPYWPFKKGWQFMKRSNQHFALLEKYDHQILL